MKKYLFAIFAVFVFAGIALAHQITANPFTTESGTGNLRIQVYNNSASTLDAGDVVVWDIDASPGDNDMWVTTTTTADTALVAGVIWPAAITSGSVGDMVIYGLAECDIASSSIAEAHQICTSTTAGSGKECAATSSYHYAIASVAVSGAGQGACFVNVR
jgi:hypothetical protein